MVKGLLLANFSSKTAIKPALPSKQSFAPGLSLHLKWYALRIHAPRLLNHYDRAGQKAKYGGELFPSDQPIGNYGMDSFELFQQDRKYNKKGIIAIDLVRLSL